MTTDNDALVAELRAFQDAVDEWNALLDDGGDGHTLSGRAADRLEALEAELDILRATEDGRVSELRERAEEADRERDSAVKEMHARELHHFETEQAITEALARFSALEQRTGGWSQEVCEAHAILTATLGRDASAALAARDRHVAAEALRTAAASVPRMSPPHDVTLWLRNRANQIESP